MSAVAVALALVGIALFAGCEIDGPVDERERRGSGSADVVGDHTEPGHDAARRVKAPETPRAPRGPGGGSSPARVVSLYAAVYSNWSWRGVDRVNAILARLAAGELRRRVSRNRRGLQRDPSLSHQRPANRSTELALDVQGSAAGSRTAWVVLRETASARGAALPSDTRVTVYRATVKRLGAGRWYVTEFEPQG